MERIPDWQLERYALGELPPERLAAIRARLDTDPALAARLAALEADDRAFLQAWPARRVVPGLEARAASAAPSRRAWLLVPMLATAALAVVVARVPDGVVGGGGAVDGGAGEVAGGAVGGGVEDREAGRVKGVRPELRVYRNAGGHIERLAPGASARAGDLLQLGYVAAGTGYGVVVSIDGNGVVTDHARGEHGAALALERSGEVPLVSAYELDAAPRFERFFLVASDAPFDYAPVRAAAEQLAAEPDADIAPLDLPASLAQTSFLVVKVAR